MAAPNGNDELRAWVDGWSGRYPDSYDEPFDEFDGVESLGHAEAKRLYEWKFRGMWPQRKINAMLARPEPEVRDLTRRAFACDDELGALLILNQVPGLSTAGSSAVLAAQSPKRYTVMDRRALASLVALSRWSSGRRTAEARDWLVYLDVCRAIAEEVDRSLRMVDRALWKANGDPQLPP